MFAHSMDPRIRLPRWCLVHLSVIATFALTIASGRLAFAQAVTATTLAITSSGSAVTSISSGTVVTLTATVVSGSTPVTPGQVEFCDTSVSYCTDIFLVALSQLTKTGTAAYKFRPGGGNHSYKAVFLGTKTYAGSSSSVSSLSVTGPFPSVTGISSSTSGDTVTLTAQVSGGMSSSGSPTGTVSFLDTSNSNAVLATAPLGTGAPGLSFSSPYTIPPYTYNTAVADFNLDGIPDIAQSNVYLYPGLGYIVANLTTFLGNGDGTFNQGATESVSSSMSANNGWANGMAVGDFNSDGIPDLVVADAWLQGPEVFLGNGDGSFSGPPSGGGGPLCGNPSFSGGCGAVSVAVADFNGDGIPDLVVAGGGQNNFDELYVQVYLGSGDGSFGGPLPVEIIQSSWQTPGLFVAVGDFNGDGIPDLAVVSNGIPDQTYANPGPGDVTIFPGNGDGTFGTPSTFAVESGPNAFAVADFNKDGNLDLAVTNGLSNTVSIFLGKGDGTFTPASQTPETGSNPNAMTVGDFNGDGIPDLAVIGGSGKATILLGNGDGTFAAPVTETPATTFLNGVAWWSIASGDLNGEGLTDLVASSSVYLAQSGWTATAEATNVAVTAAGTHLVEASYSGDAKLNPSVSGTVSIGELQSATMTSPVPGSQLSSATVTFEWTAGSGVTAYTLSVGTKGPGSTDIYASPVLTTTSAAVSGLPASAATVYVKLSSQINGVWQPEYYVYTVTGPAGSPALTAPAPGGQLSGSSVTFTWSPGTGVTDYALHVGTNWPSGANIYSSPAGTATSATATGLPTDGVTLYVSLFYRIKGVWNFIPYIYTAAGSTTPPALISPTPGSKFSGSTVTFTWSPGSGVTKYQLYVGTNWPGGSNIYGSPISIATSATATGVPTDGTPVYVALRYQINGVWNIEGYTYTAAGSAVLPALTTPTPGSKLSGSTVTFAWTAGTGVKAYALHVSNYAPGGDDFYSSGTITTTSATVSGLPTNGPTLYVTHFYQIGSVWNNLDYTYTAAGLTVIPPALITPTPGTLLSSSNITFDWTSGVNIQQYALTIYTESDGTATINYHDYYGPNARTATVPNPAPDGPIYVIFGYKVDDIWYNLNYAYPSQ